MDKESIEKQLQYELKRLKDAIDYIERLEKAASEIQHYGKDELSKIEKEIEDIRCFKREVEYHISDASKRFEKIESEVNSLVKSVDFLSNEIEQNHNEILRRSNLKWYQRIFK